MIFWSQIDRFFGVQVWCSLIPRDPKWGPRRPKTPQVCKKKPTSAAQANARKSARSCSVSCIRCPWALAMPSVKCNAIQCNTIQYRPATQVWGSHAIDAMQCNTMQLTTIYPRVQKAKLTTNIPKSAEGQSHNNTPKTAEGQAHIILPIHNRRNRTPKSEKPNEEVI